MACSSPSPSPSPSPTPAPTPAPTPTPTPRATATAEPAGTTALLEALASLPASVKKDGVWFGDIRRTLELAGIEKVDSLAGFLALGAGAMEYQSALAQIAQPVVALTAGEGNLQWGRLFGFDSFTPDVAAGTGVRSTTPGGLVYMRGPFDGSRLSQRLEAAGFERTTHEGVAVFSLGADYSVPDGELGSVVGSRMARVALRGNGTVAAAPASSLIEGFASAASGTGPSLAQDPAFVALARSLGNPLSATLMTIEKALLPSGTPPPHLDEFQRPPGWGFLGDWDAMAAGYREDGAKRSWRWSLHYAAPADAARYGPELAMRLQTYPSLLPDLPTTGQLLVAQSCETVDWAHRPLEEGSILTATCILGDDPAASWIFLVNRRDLGFLIP